MINQFLFGRSSGLSAISFFKKNKKRMPLLSLTQPTFMKKIIYISILGLLITACSQQKEEHKTETKQQTETIKEKTSPSIKVIDTDFSKGRLTLTHEINLENLEKFHGHLCDGLVVGFLGIKEGLEVLYPNGIIDRTNTRIVSKSSPCLTDVAVYITGGRYQFNSFYVDNSIENGFYIIQRKDNGKAVKVNLNKGIKPQQIDELGAKAVKGELPACDLDKLKKMEDDFSNKLLSTNPKDNFSVTEITDFKWKPVLKNDFIKTDILNKNKSNCKLITGLIIKTVNLF
jgi:acetolactate decarboxylase